jgi:hypothetical protein
MIRLIITLALALIIAPSLVHSADKNGMFMRGGGVGSVGCPQFLNAMATARQSGGLQSLTGIKLIQGYVMYILGFQTGFNSQAEGVYDIWSPLGDDPANSALYAIEPWCQQHPEANFGQGVIALADKLQSYAK